MITAILQSSKTAMCWRVLANREPGAGIRSMDSVLLIWEIVQVTQGFRLRCVRRVLRARPVWPVATIERWWGPGRADADGLVRCDGAAAVSLFVHISAARCAVAGERWIVCSSSSRC
eukprot:COSAG03_NODE_3405_length_2038_cov_2.005673_2_plen_117_part_00